MPLTMRTILTAAVPALAALFGIFWFRRKKKPPAIEAPKLPKEECKVEEEVIVVNTQQVFNSTPRVFVTQPSQATPQEESFDVTEALAKAVVESISEVPGEEKAESDSEEESVESVVTAIEASSTSAAEPSESDIGVIEDACTSSGTSSEVNTPSPCDTIDKQIAVNEAVIELKSVPLETEHIKKIEVESNRSVLSIKEQNSKAKNDDEAHVGDNALTNGLHQDEVEKSPSHEAHLANGKFENESNITETSQEDDNEPPSWSDTIELSENNNVNKAEEEICLDPFKTESTSSQVSESSSDEKSSPSSKLSASASKSQGNVSTTAASKYQSAKQSKSTSSAHKGQKVSESKKSPRSQQTSKGKSDFRGKDHQSSSHKKGKHPERSKTSLKDGVNENGDGMDVVGEDTSDWGNQAEALPNGTNSDTHSEVNVTD